MEHDKCPIVPLYAIEKKIPFQVDRKGKFYLDFVCVCNDRQIFVRLTDCIKLLGDYIVLVELKEFVTLFNS